MSLSEWGNFLLQILSPGAIICLFWKEATWIHVFANILRMKMQTGIEVTFPRYV